MESKIFSIPGYITKISTMAKNTIRLQVDSQENVSGEAMKRIFDVIDQLGNFVFVVNKEIQPEDLLSIPAPEPEFKNEKSDSLRLRNVLFRLWEQNKEGYEDFNLYYKYRMNKIIEFLKSKLD
jgi:hypothetical protein